MTLETNFLGQLRTAPRPVGLARSLPDGIDEGVADGLRDATIAIWRDLLDGAGGKRLLALSETAQRQSKLLNNLRAQLQRSQATVARLDSALEAVKAERDLLALELERARGRRGTEW